MYRVLLVDDEENVLEILKMTIQWQELGVDKIFTAHDGQEALDVMQKQSIDLLFTDIKMPRLDGLNLIRKVRKLYPHIRCILLTAYGEFEYAREAITLGVENYLLKPVAKDEVEQTVQKALDNLYGKRENGNGLLLENILRRWVAGTIAEEELSERALVLGLNLYLPEYCIICLVKKSDDNAGDFRTGCVELLHKQYDVYSFWDEKGRYVLIIGGRHLDTGQMAKQLMELAEQYELEGKISISLGTPISDAGSLHLSYQMACDSVELSDLKHSGFLLQNDYLSQGFEADYLVEEIRFLFFSSDEQMRRNGYKHLGMKLYQAVENGETDKAFVRILGICMRVLLTEFPLQQDFRDKLFAEKWKIEKGQPQEIFVAEVDKMLRFVQQIFEDSFAQFSPVVQLAVWYVRNGVMEGSGGSVKEFCARNGMNPAYLGHLYKQETGFFFNDYLNQCRINRSVILLRNPNNKIKDIAEEVGFMSISYYVKCFRESKGVSPAKYRMGIKE